MKKKLVMISLSIMLITLLSINVKSYNDYEGNHNDLECHGVEKEQNEKKVESFGFGFILLIIISLLISIILSLIYIYSMYLER